MKIVVMAGGKGTRISSLNAEVPKPMIKILGKPVLEYQIESFQRQGFRDITIVIGHLGHVIREYFGDGAKWKVRIDYVEETEPLGTAGGLYFLKDRILTDFLLVNGDIVFDVDLRRFKGFHEEKGADVTLFTHPNDHPFDSSLLIADSTGRVTKWLSKEDVRGYCKNRVNAGLHMMSRKVLDLFTELKKVDLDRDILKPSIPSGKVYAYDSPEYVKDMGTPERYYRVERDIKNRLVEAKALYKRQKAIFLDRDGTINKSKGFISKEEDFVLESCAGEAIRKINMSGYLAIVVSNQPVIARGECSLEELGRIHDKMETLLGESNAYLDDIFFCPHHPDKGFEGERAEYKIECECRKPKPGMILRAAEKYNIDLSRSYMIGDEEKDVMAGKAAGCGTVLLGKGRNGEKIESPDTTAVPDSYAGNLLDAIDRLRLI